MKSNLKIYRMKYIIIIISRTYIIRIIIKIKEIINFRFLKIIKFLFLFKL